MEKDPRLFNKMLVIGIIVLLNVITVFPVAGIVIDNSKLEDKRINDEETYIINSQGDNIDWWPQLQHDPQNTGFSTSTAPNTNSILWTCKLPKSRAILSHSIVADNRVYICGAGEDLRFISGYPFIEDRDFGGKLYCIDAITGGLLWMIDYPLEGELPHNIIEGTPVVYNNKVYVCPYSIYENKGEVHCYDAINGNLLWKSDYIGRLEWGGPTIVDEKLYIVTRVGSGIREGKIDCLNATNGEILWSFSDRQLNGCPAIVDDRVYIGKRGSTDHENDYNVCCLNASTGELVWRWYNPLKQGSVSSPLVVDDKVFIGSEGYGETYSNGSSKYFPGEIFCINAVTGKTIWVSDIDEDILACTAFDDGKIFAGSNVYMDLMHPLRQSGYTFYCLDANSGEVIWEKSIPIFPGIMNPPSLSSPVIADGKVFFAAPNRFSCTYYCLNALTGDKIWSYKVLGWLTISPGAAVADGQLYFSFSTMGCRNGKLYCFGDVDPNAPPAPSISGKKIGATEKEYEYTFKSTVPNDNDVYYYISWGDGTIEDWIGPFNSGEEAKAYHTWSEKGLYEIRVRAKDDEGLRGSIGIKRAIFI